MPINKVFTYWGRKWIVKTTTNPAMGLGLFAMQDIVVDAEDEEDGVELFAFGGAVYGPGDWNKIVPKHRFPAIRKYAITANKHTRNWHIAAGRKPPAW